MNKKLYIAGFIFIFLISFVSAGLIVGKTNENNKIVELVTPKPEEITQFLPFNYTVQAGIEDWGNISSINKSNDGFYLNVSEVGGSPAMTIIINFTGVTGFSNIIMRHKYSGGAGHIIRLGLFNCIGGDYEEEYPPDITDMEIFAFALYNVLDPDVHLCNGNVSLRIRQVDNGIAMHDFFLDFITLQLGATTIVAQEVDPFALYKDGSVIATGNFDWGGFNITNLDVVIANIFKGSGANLFNVNASNYWRADDGTEDRNFNTTGNVTADNFLGNCTADLIKVDHIAEKTPGHNVVVDNILFADTTLRLLDTSVGEIRSDNFQLFLTSTFVKTPIRTYESVVVDGQNRLLFPSSNVWDLGRLGEGTNAWRNLVLEGDANVGGIIDLGTNTISDGQMTGDWDFSNAILRFGTGKVLGTTGDFQTGTGEFQNNAAKIRLIDRISTK